MGLACDGHEEPSVNAQTDAGGEWNSGIGGGGDDVGDNSGERSDVGFNGGESSDAGVPSDAGEHVEGCPVAVAAGSVDGGDTFEESLSAETQDVVQLSSDGSYSPDNGELSYEWSFVLRPANSMADFEPGPSDPNPEIEIDTVGAYQIELMVYDEDDVPACEPAVVDIATSSSDDVGLMLTWTAPEVEAEHGGPSSSEGIGTDLDIHYINAGGQDEWGGDESVYWAQSMQNWGADGEVTLDIDDLYGEGPEIISHNEPADGGIYRVGVHYFNDDGWGSSEATVHVHFDGELYGEYSRSINATDHFWYVGNVMGGDPPTFDELDDYQESSSLQSAADSGF